MADAVSDERQTETEGDGERRSTRRGFLLGATEVGTAATLAGGAFAPEDGEASYAPRLKTDDESDSVPIPGTDGPRHWLGPHLWGNRLQDWQVRRGRLECLRGEAGYELRTAGLLTREVVSGGDSGHLRVRTGTIDDGDGDGFCGFLVGVGSGDLDYRAAALAQRSSGGGGGLLCTYEADGRVRFRDHTDEEAPVAYEELPPDTVTEKTPSGESASDADVRLSVDFLPETEDRFSVYVTAYDTERRTVLSSAVRRGVPEEELLGGIALVSSPLPGIDGPRWWFDRLRTGGRKVAAAPERTFGPVVGTLYSVNESVVKLSAQLFPMSDADPEDVELLYRPGDGDGAVRTRTATLGPGHTALFRVEGWDASRAWDYRVVYEDATGQEWGYDGRIDADPVDTDELTVGLLGCTIACGRQLDHTKPRSEFSQKSVPARYTPENLYFPYETLAENLSAQEPDLLVSTGDQFYEGSPTRVEDREDPELDYLYKWYLWLWAFGDLTRKTPTIVLTDDHDHFQRDLWGARGKKTTMENLHEGGYVGTADFVNRVVRTQCGHNPDPYDPTPVGRGISVYYGAFTYGGTSFSLLESRTFKLGPKVNRSREPRDRVLLGERQQRFLKAWATQNTELPKVCLTQTIFSGVRTTAKGNPFGGYDTNAYPKAGRDRALDALREAGALVLAGDQHLATLVRHGIDGATDGVVQFTGPAGDTLYQRWFVPDGDLPNDRGYPNTGEFADGHGNEFRVLAAANPTLSYDEALKKHGSIHVFDRQLKSEGYGIVRVNRDEEAFVIECWPRTADPTDPDAEQFPGWPYRLPFDETDGRRQG